MPEVRAASDTGLGTRIEITGFADSTLALSHVNEEMAKAFRKRLRQTGVMVAETSKRSAPSRSSAMQAGYKTRLRSRGTTTVVQVMNQTAQGMILEFAGSKSAGKTAQGQSLIRSLNSRYGETGRFMWAAFDLLEPYIVDQVNDAVRDVENYLDSRFSEANA